MEELKSQNYIESGLTIKDSLLIKGVAICLMLWHHLFYQHPEFGSFIYITGLLSKVCVAMFLFISAYGLTVQLECKGACAKDTVIKPKNLMFFLMKRLSRLYLNFWFVFLLFVPLGIFVFGRSLEMSYGSEHTHLWLFVDFLGLAGERSYNATWWFYQLIIVLYVLFPFLYAALKKSSLIVLLFCSLLLAFHRITIPVIHDWLFVFALGSWCAIHRQRISLILNKTSYIFLLFLSVLAFCVFAYIRLNSVRFGGVRIDGFFTVSILMLIILSIQKLSYTEKSLHIINQRM